MIEKANVMGKRNTPAEITGYKIVGHNCGRDENGVFRCMCGMCRPLREQSKDSSDSGNDSSDSGNDTNSSV